MLDFGRWEPGESGAMVIRSAGKGAVGCGLEACTRGIGWVDDTAWSKVGGGCFQACKRGAQLKGWIGEHGGEWG